MQKHNSNDFSSALEIACDLINEAIYAEQGGSLKSRIYMAHLEFAKETLGFAKGSLDALNASTTRTPISSTTDATPNKAECYPTGAESLNETYQKARIKAEAQQKEKPAHKLRKPRKPSPESFTTQTGAAVALFANGEDAQSVAEDTGFTKMQCVQIRSLFKDYIAAYKALPIEGSARYAYLQKHFGMGVSK
jgi:hypothetical protein